MDQTLKNTAKATPLVTVLMSCFNAADWLVESVDSVLKQTYTDFEFLIIDDGSTDSSLEILQQYALLDDRIVLLSKLNTGLADSLNVGLRCARGIWIARMDADDICEQNRLEKQVAYTSMNPNAVFVGSGLTIIDEKGSLGTQFQYPSSHTVLLEHLLTARRFPPHASAFYRRELVLEIGGYRGRIRRAEDYDLWLRLSDHGDIACIKEPLMRIRKHSGQISLSAGGRDQIVDCRLAIISYLLRRARVVDPIDDDELNYQRFVEWVRDRLHAAEYFEFMEWKSNLRAYDKLTLIKILFNSVFQKPSFIIRFAREKAIGDRFAFDAGREWLATSNKK
jgi:glycosyltransferase involved in cell wall biosynthesis